MDAAGHTVPLEAQDRGLYDGARVREAGGLLDRALAARRPGPYQVQAAIAVLHARAPRPQDTDWREIAALYGTLARMAPSPVVELNRAAAIGMADGPQAGLTALDALRPALEHHHVLHAARADLLRRSGRRGDAVVALRRALALAPAGGSDRADTRPAARRARVLSWLGQRVAPTPPEEKDPHACAP